MDGRSGGHVSISGISGVATKTSYALFLLYQLLETEQGMDLLGGRSGRESVRALVFNTKGEDLLHVDRPNAEFAARPDEIDKWRALGIDDPGPFRSVRLYAPRRSGVQTNVADVKTRKTADVNAYGWTPEQFIHKQLLQFCFTSDDLGTGPPGWFCCPSYPAARHAPPWRPIRTEITPRMPRIGANLRPKRGFSG